MTRSSKPQSSGKNEKTSNGAGSSGRLKFTPPHMTADQIISNGRDAGSALNSTVFNLAVQSTVSSLQDQIIATQPHEVQKREWLNLQVQALGAVCTELAVMLSEAKALSAASLNDEANRQQDQQSNKGFSEGVTPGYEGAYTG